MKAGKKILIGFIIIAVIFALLVFSFDRILVSIIRNTGNVAQLEKVYDIVFCYKHCRPALSGQIIFDDLSIFSRKTGYGFICKAAELRPELSSGSFALNFNLRDVSFTKEGGCEEPRYDSIAALAAIPFDKKWKYGYIQGRIEPGENKVGIRNFKLSGNDITANFNGSFTYDGLIDFDIKIYFSSALTAKIPPELANTILGEEKDGWRSLSVKLAGDPNKPSVQISSKLFRLNIRAISESGNQSPG